MSILYANHPLFFSPSGWQEGTLIPSSRAGFQRIQISGSEVLSVQPSNTQFRYETRPLSSDGGYEQFQIVGDKLVVTPDVAAVIPFVALG